MGKNQHVVPYGDHWAVRGSGNIRISFVHRTQGAAVEAGERRAKAEKSELIIHGKDGRIRDRDSYGHDPFPPRDTKH